MELLIACIGAIMNRVRGGGLTNLAWKQNWANEGDETFWKKFSKHSNDVTFGLIFTYLIDWFNPPIFLILTLSMWLGRSFGWGRYIGGLIEKKVIDDEEIKWIDDLVLSKEDCAILRNIAALSLRGLIWSLLIGVGFLIISGLNISNIPLSFLWIIPVGLLMGFTYYITVTLSGKFLDNRGKGWGLGEVLFGFILWGSIAFIL